MEGGQGSFVDKSKAAPAPMEQPSVTEQKPKRRSKTHRSKRKGKPGKIRIRLPPIEAYEKEICFPAEAPGRVVVRLERLMGSDKIRPVDGKYMETLIQRLEEEENLAWERKIRLRKKAEKDRHRQLAINGLMEPGPGMEDLYNHPVFRVNRILNRLNRLDNSFANKPGQKLPPICQIDPFKDDDTGKYFCDYPTHVALRKECEKYHIEEDEKEAAERIRKEMEEMDEVLASPTSRPMSVKDIQRAMTAAPPPSVASLQREEEDESETDEELGPVPYTQEADVEEEDDEDEAGEEEGLTEMEEVAATLGREYMESLTTLRARYGVPESDDFEEKWKAYRSEIVEKFFTDPESLEEIYDESRKIFEMYTRQDLAALDHIVKSPLSNTKSEMPIIAEEDEDEGEDEEEDEEVEGEDSATPGDADISELDVPPTEPEPAEETEVETAPEEEQEEEPEEE